MAAAGDMAEGRPARPVATEANDEVGEFARAFQPDAGARLGRLKAVAPVAPLRLRTFRV